MQALGASNAAEPQPPLKFRLTPLEGQAPAGEPAWNYQDGAVWTRPEPTLPTSACDSLGRTCDPVLTPLQVQQFQQEGFVLVDGLLDGALIAEAVAQAQDAYPADSSVEELVEAAKKVQHTMPFPQTLPAFNQLPIAPRLLRACEQVCPQATCGACGLYICF